MTVGYLSEDLISSDRESRSLYGVFSGSWHLPTARVSFFQKDKLVEDDIPENRLRWVDPVGIEDFTDPLENQDTFVNTSYLELRYWGTPKLNLSGKLKYETFVQRGDQADVKRNRSFFGFIAKADYAMQLRDDLILWPKWKSILLRQTPSSRDLLKSKEITQLFFLIGRYSLLPDTWVEFGAEFGIFENLIKRPDQPPPGFVDDFRSIIVSVLISNTDAYLGYQLTLNTGLQLERRRFRDETQRASTAFMRIFASTGER